MDIWLGLGILGVVIAVAAVAVMIIGEKTKTDQRDKEGYSPLQSRRTG